MQKTALEVCVISQHPPGGRCSLYAGYAETLAECLSAQTKMTIEVVISKLRAAHGEGYPSLLLDGAVVPPADGVILMPADILAALSKWGLDGESLVGLAESLEAPLERMLESTE